MSSHQPSSEPNELSRLLRIWRGRLNPGDVPGLNAAYPRTRRRRPASKELVAFLTGCSVRWYSILEAGEAQNYSDDFLNRVAYTLRLNPDEKSQLFYLATGHAPTIDPGSRMECTPTVQRVLDVQPWPAYVSDEAWDLVGYNEHMRSWFPWVAGHENNIMRWVFTFPEARTQLHRWDTDWGPQMFAQMQYAQARAPENKRLNEVIEEILDRNPDARRFKENPIVYPHPDGNHRSLHLPFHQEVRPIELVAFAPLRALGSRFMMLVPLDNDS